MLVHANQAEMIRRVCVEHLRAYPLPPLQREVVLVQSNGIAQWLAGDLSVRALSGHHHLAGALLLLRSNSRFGVIKWSTEFPMVSRSWRASARRFIPASIQHPD